MMSLVSQPLNSAGLDLIAWNSKVSLTKMQNLGSPFMGGTTSPKPPLQSPPPIPLLSLKKDKKRKNAPAHVEDWGGEPWFGGAPTGLDWSSRGFPGIAQGGPQGGVIIHQSFNPDLVEFGAAWPQPWPVYWDDLIAGSWGFMNLAALGVSTLNMYFVVGAAPDTAMYMSLVCHYFKKITPNDELILQMQANNVHNFSGLKPDFTASYTTGQPPTPAPTHVFLALSVGAKGMTLAKTSRFGN